MDDYPVCSECGKVMYYGGADYVREHGVCRFCNEGPIYRDGDYPDQDDIDEHFMLHEL